MAFAGRPKGRCFPHYCSWRNLSITIDKKRQPKPPLEPASLPATATRFIRHAQWTFCPQQPSHSQESHKYPVTVSLSFQGCFYLLFSYFFKKEKEKGDIKGGKNPKVTFKCDFWSQETALGWPSSGFDTHSAFHPQRAVGSLTLLAAWCLCSEESGQDTDGFQPGMLPPWEGDGIVWGWI